MSATEAAVALSGPPRNVAGIIALDVARTTVIPISVTAGGQATLYRATARAAGKGRAEIRLRLPNDMLPGVYVGEGTIDGRPRRLSIEVDPTTIIRVQPERTSVTATPGSSVEFTITVINGGNIPLDVPKADTFDLDDPIGQDRALGKSLRAEIKPAEKRVDRFFEELKDSHGGEAKVAVRVGAGRLEPGDARELACVLTVPATSQAGRSYVGVWQLGNAAHVIVADIMASTRSPKEKAKAKR